MPWGGPYRPARTTPTGASPDLLEVHHEDERLTRRDRGRRPGRAVAQVGRDDQLAAAAHAHAGDALVPALDHLAGAELERERLAAVPRGVELLAGRPRGADVLDG